MHPLKAHRKAAHLTQTEMGILLGYSDRGPIHSYERESRELTLHCAIGYSLIFNVPIEELMPELVAQIRAALRERTCNLHNSLTEWTAHRDHKQQVLRELYNRLTPTDSS